MDSYRCHNFDMVVAFTDDNVRVSRLHDLRVMTWEDLSYVTAGSVQFLCNGDQIYSSTDCAILTLVRGLADTLIAEETQSQVITDESQSFSFTIKPCCNGYVTVLESYTGCEFLVVRSSWDTATGNLISSIFALAQHHLPELSDNIHFLSAGADMMEAVAKPPQLNPRDPT